MGHTARASLFELCAGLPGYTGVADHNAGVVDQSHSGRETLLQQSMAHNAVCHQCAAFAYSHSYAVPGLLQDDIFEWHFVVRGPPDTEFEVCCAWGWKDSSFGPRCQARSMQC